MDLYIANGVYVGTQADARKLDKDFKPVKVPVDKQGLMAFLNEHVADARPMEPSSMLNVDATATDIIATTGAFNPPAGAKDAAHLAEFIADAIGSLDLGELPQVMEAIADRVRVEKPLPMGYAAAALADDSDVDLMTEDDPRYELPPITVADDVDPLS